MEPRLKLLLGSSFARRLAASALFSLLVIFNVQAQIPLPQYKIATASSRGTYIVIGRDLCTFVAPDAGFDCEAIATDGSAQNVFQLRFEAGVKFAIVQSDVYQAFLDKAKVGNKEAINLIQPLRVILPLYNEEIYFVVRADSPLQYVHEIKDARIAVGAYGSGTALTSVTLYSLMFHEPMVKQQLLSNEDALVKLTGDKSVDVVVIVGGQPMKLLADMKPEAKQLLKLLKFDPTHPASLDALKTYVATSIRATSYPNLLTEDMPGIAVKAFLVTYDYNLQQTQVSLRKFAKSLCQHFSDLQAGGHPKWKEVSLDLPELGAGWSYYYPTAREIRGCVKMQQLPAPVPRAQCGQIEFVLGICGKP